MYCGQCGKKINDDMRFCPFCGLAVVVPDQEEDEDTPARPEKKARNEAWKRFYEYLTEETHSPDDAEDEAQTDEDEPKAGTRPYKPLRLRTQEKAAAKKAEEEPEEAIEDEAADQEPPVDDSETEDEEDELQPIFPLRKRPQSERMRRSGAPSLDGNRRRRTKAFIPVRRTRLNDMFMESDDEIDADELEFEDEYRDVYADELAYEERGSFYERHVRGFVALLLLALIVIVLIVFFKVTGPGQRMLAGMNLATDPAVYAELGKEAWDKGSYEQAERYYREALERDSDNYDLAHLLMVAAQRAKDYDTMNHMMLRCLELDPLNDHGIREQIASVYPDPATRPWEINEAMK